MKTPTSHSGSGRRNFTSLICIAALLAVVALIAIPLFSSSLASTARQDLGVGTASAPTARGVSNHLLSKRQSAQTSDSLFTSNFAPFAPFSLMLPQSPAETVETFASDCTTPKTDFDLGETVCAKISGAPLPVDGRAQRRIGWVSPYGSLAQGAEITTDPQTGTYLIPTEQTQTFTDDGGGTVVVDNRGTWSVNTFSASDGSLRTSAYFTVHDPATPYVDLGVGQSVSETNSTVAAGSSSIFTMIVSNRGPDAGATVVLAGAVPNDSTFVAFTQVSGPTFSCTTPLVGATGAITCTIASLAKDVTATFDLAYNVNVGTANGTIITSNATISSATAELVPEDNASTRSAKVGTGGTGGGTGTCSVACPDDVTTPANTTQDPNDPNSPPGAVIHFSPPSGNTECGTIVVDHCNDCFFPVGTTVVTATGAGDSCSFTVTVTAAGTGTTISCPSNKTADAGANCDAQVDPGTPTATGTNVTISGARSDGQPLNARYPVGITTITWTATSHDAQGEETGNASCTQTIEVTGAEDTTPPTVTAPADSSASADSNCQAAIPDYAAGSTTSDNCGSTPTLAQSPAAGTLVGTGPHTVTVTATDDAGNQSSDTVVFTVNDTTAPTVTAPADSSALADANCQAPIPDYTAGSTASDNCGTPSLTQSPAAGTLVGTGPHTVTVTATDGSGNSSSDTVVFTVNDTTAPTVTAPADSSASADASCQAPIPDYTAGSTASDNCGTPTLTQSPAAGTLVGKGPHTVTVTATDSSGNSSSDTVVFTVNDTTAPVITCPANITSPNDPGTCSANINPGSATATDNCDTPTVSGTRSDGQALTAPYPKGTTTITWTATDGSNNSSSCAQTVTVNDTEAPTISCPSNITKNNDPGECGAVVTYTAPVGQDNCPGATTAQTAGLPSGSKFPVGTTTNTFEVTDSSGNKTSCSFTVTVNDVENPVISCPQGQTLEPTCPSGAVATWTEPVGTDNCPGATTTRTGPAPGSLFPIGSTTVTYTVNDAHGHSASCSFTVTVKSVLQTIDDLRASVNANQQLSGPQRNGLLSKLDAAKQHIQNGNQNAACAKLADFINSTQNFINHGNVSAAVGNAWISTANNIRNAYGCTNNPCT